MKSKILEYLDFEKTNTLLEGFNQSTGFASTILDLDGNILCRSEWSQICKDFHRVHTQTALNCSMSGTESDTTTGNNEAYHFHTCRNGLIAIRIPIVIRGEQVANLYSGQFFFEKPDLAFFKRQAEVFGFDESAYLEALGKVPVVSKDKAEIAMKFLLDLIGVTIDLASDKFEQAMLNEVIRKSKTALFDNQAHLRQYMDDLLESQRVAHLGTWRMDIATNEVVWSEELYKLYGFDPTIPPPSYTEHMKLFTQESWDKLSASVARTSTSGIPYELELETVRIDGSNGWLWVRGEGVADSNNKIVSLRGTVQDITARKQTEEALRESEERFQLLFNKAPLGYQSLDFDGRFIEVNQKWLQTLGYSREEVIGAWFGDFLCPEYVDGFRQRFPIFKSQGYIHSEFEMLSKDGQRLYMSFEGKIGYAADGGFKQTHCILQDITNQKLAEKASEENAFRFQSLFNEMSTGAAIYKVLDDGQYGKDYIIQDFNNAALKAEGRTKNDVLGKSLYDLRPNIDNYGLIPVFQEVWKSGEPARFPAKIYVDDKFSNWYENSIFKLPSGEIVAIFEDVTEKMRAQEVIEKQNDLFVSLLKLLPVGVLMVDATEGKPLVINDMGKALLGSGILPDANDHNLSEDYKAYRVDTLEQYPNAEMPITLGMRGINSHIDDMIVERPDGTKILLEVFGTPINDTEGKPWASLVTFMDITDRKRSEKELYLSERKYRTIIETTQDGIWAVNVKGQITDVNETYCRMIGYTKAELLGMNVSDLDVLETPLDTAEHIKKLMENGSDLFETRHRKKDGSLLDIEVSSTFVDSTDTMFAFCRDITKRKGAEKQLQQSMDDLLESQRVAHLGTWRLDLATNEVVWSEELYKLYGFDPTIPPPPYTEHMKLFTPESWDKLSTSLERTTTSGIPYELELETVRIDGSNGWMWVRGEALKDSNNKIVSLWGTAQDITARKKNENELVYLSVHDHLTGLYNRRFFEQELHNLDTIGNLPLSVIMCDVNGLKLINDSFGHDSGDTLLKKAADTIRRVCREEDIFARIGGDEFVLLLPKTSEHESIKIANHIKELASKEKVANIELSISYGIDSKTDEKQSIIEIVANAENHMYRHKLYERSSIRSKTIDLIMNALFEKSNREAAHSKRVSSLCQSIASEMKMNKDAVNQMKIAGLIHDIGKIGVNESILNKPGSLTINERIDIEKHPEIGWRLLSSTNEFSELAQFVLHHHERWDGRGYPNGLKGEEIQIEARIIAIADAFDAMTSERSYRKALTRQEAIIELMKCSGTQFDPGIVQVFVNQVLLVPGTKLTAF